MKPLQWPLRVILSRGPLQGKSSKGRYPGDSPVDPPQNHLSTHPSGLPLVTPWGIPLGGPPLRDPFWELALEDCLYVLHFGFTPWLPPRYTPCYADGMPLLVWPHGMPPRSATLVWPLEYSSWYASWICPLGMPPRYSPLVCPWKAHLGMPSWYASFISRSGDAWDDPFVRPRLRDTLLDHLFLFWGTPLGNPCGRPSWGTTILNPRCGPTFWDPPLGILLWDPP